MNETITNLLTLLESIMLYVIPFILVVLTLIVHSSLIEKFNKNLSMIINAISDFLDKLTTDKIKLSLLILTIVYVVLEGIYLIVRS